MYPYIHTNKTLFKLQREEILSFHILFNIQESQYLLPRKTINPPIIRCSYIELYRT